MRICSFLPAATRIIQELGFSDSLCGVTFECAIDRPRVVRSRLEGENLSSAEIDRRVKESQLRGESLYYLDEPLLQKIQPDVVFIQDVCRVCQIDVATACSVLNKLKVPPKIIPLNPMTLEDVLDDIETVADALDEQERGIALSASLKQRTVVVKQKTASLPTREVCFIEWVQPLYHCGHWIPEQIAIAGGTDPFGTVGGYSGELDWARIQAADPEVLVVSPCGFDAQRSLEEIASLANLPEWNELRAVRHGEVYAVDSHLFTEPGPDLFLGIELLAGLFHAAEFAAAEFAAAEDLKNRSLPFGTTSLRNRKTPHIPVSM